MGYFTYKILKNVSFDDVERKTIQYLHLFEADADSRGIEAHIIQGDGCVAITHGFLLSEDQVLAPVCWMMDCVWMDVRYQDGNSWDVSVYEETKHRVTHSVNPWAYDEDPQIDNRLVNLRADLVCEHWPKQAEMIRKYLQTWRIPEEGVSSRKWKRREGKAYPTDEHACGDAYQIIDFLRAFGIGTDSQTKTVKAEQDAAGQPATSDESK